MSEHCSTESDSSSFEEYFDFFGQPEDCDPADIQKDEQYDNLINNIVTNSSQAKPSNTIPWSVESHKNTQDNQKVDFATLRYSIKADCVLCSISFNHDGTTFAYCDGLTVFVVSSQDGSLLYSVE